MQALIHELTAAADFGLAAPFLLVSGPAADAMTAANVHKTTDSALGHPRMGLAQAGVMAVVESALHYQSVAVSVRNHRLGLIQAVGQRLFTQDVLPQLQNGGEHLSVEMGWSADQDRLCVGVVDNFLPPLRRPASELLRQPLCRRQVDVRYSYEPVTVAMAQGARAAPALEPRAHEAHANPLRHVLICLSPRARHEI